MNDKQQTTKSKAALIWDFLRGSKRYFVVAILSAAASSLSEMINPQIIRITLDHVIGSNPTDALSPAVRAGPGFALRRLCPSARKPVDPGAGHRLRGLLRRDLPVPLPRVQHQRRGDHGQEHARPALRPHRAPALRLAHEKPHRRHHPALHLRHRHAQALRVRAADVGVPHRDPADPLAGLHARHEPAADADRVSADAADHRLFPALSQEDRRGLSRLRRERGQALGHGAGEPDGRARGARLRAGALREGSLRGAQRVLHRPLGEALARHEHLLELGGRVLRFPACR